MAKLRPFELISLIAAIQDSNLLSLKSVFYPDQKIQFIRETDIPLPENRQDALQVVDMVLAFSELLDEWDDPRKLDGSLSFIEKLHAYFQDLESRNLSMQSEGISDDEDES
jgi:hypothetical protein